MRLAAAVNPDRIQGSEDYSHGIPYAFRALDRTSRMARPISGGVQFTSDESAAEEAHGLALLRRAREKFSKEHATVQCAIQST